MRTSSFKFKALCLAVLTFAICQASLALAVDLTVSAAASLTNVMQEMKPIFENANPGLKLNLNFAASGPLLKQIIEGAPVDVFASADEETMNQAVAKDVMDVASRVDFTGNSLVMIVPSDSKLNLANPKDLLQPLVDRVAIGNPDSVPVGRYTRDSLMQEGLYQALQPKFVLGESVRQVLDYVSRGEVAVGFVYMTDAAIAKDKVKVVAELPGHKPITYPVALVKSTTHRAEGQKFLDFLRSDQGQALLAKYGFKKP